MFFLVLEDEMSNFFNFLFHIDMLEARKKEHVTCVCNLYTVFLVWWWAGAVEDAEIIWHILRRICGGKMSLLYSYINILYLALYG